MNSKPSTPGTGSIEPEDSLARRATPLAGDGLLGSIFDSLPAAAAPKRPPPAAAGTVTVLRLAVIGLKPVERRLLEGLVKVSQRRTALPSRASAPELPVDLVLEPEQPRSLLQQYSHTRPAPLEQL